MLRIIPPLSLLSLCDLSLVQQEAIPQAVLGTDIICQAKSGSGKTAVFVLATLQQIVPVENQVRWQAFRDLFGN